MADTYWPTSVRRALSGLAFKADTGAQLQQIGGMEAESNMQAAGWQPMPEMAVPEAPERPAPLPAVELPSLEEMTSKWKPAPQQPATSQPQAMPTGAAAAGQTRATAPQMAPQSAAASAPGQYGEIDNSSRQAFVRTAWPYMLEAAGGDANLAELMLAKAISENGDIGKGGDIIGWNVSGIKGAGDAGSFEADTWEQVNGQRVNIRDKFAAYSSPQVGFGAFMKFLQDNPRYHVALAEYQRTGNAEKLFDDVNAAGYATDPIWSQKLRSIRDTQVAPVVRGGQPQSSMNAGSATSPAQPASPSGAAGAPPASSAALPPTVAQKWEAQFGRPPTPEEAQELMGVLA